MTDRHFSMLAQWCAGLTVGLGLLAGAGWVLDILLLAQAKATFIPMAQSTLLSFIALGSGTYARARWPESRLVRQWNWGAGSAVLIFSGFLFVQSMDGLGVDLEGLLFGSPGMLGSIPMGRMSIVTAGLFILSSLSALLSLAGAEKSRSVVFAADVLGCGVFLAGFTLLLAYTYGTPLLYGGTRVPPALTTALAFVFLGLGLVALDGRKGWPVRAFAGVSMRAVLLRTFLPFITLVLLLEGWVDAQHWEFLRFNPALLAAIWIVVFALIMGAVIALLAKYRGDELDKAQQALRENEEGIRLELSLQRLRNEILQMEREEDWEKVVVIFEDELRSVVRFNACSINLVDLSQDAATLYFTLPGKVGKRATHHLLPALRQALETGQPVYRRNLEDIARYNDEVGQWGQVIQSVMDVPFIGGTIAVNSMEENAFTERDLGILEKFAQVISQGYRRLEDLRALAEAEKRFQQAQKLEAVGQLAGGVAHDFNNLLTIVTGYSQLLLRKLGANIPQYADDLNEIRRAAERGSALVRQLLAFSRKQVLRPDVLNLNTVVTEFEKMLGRLLGEDVALALHLDPSLGQVFADEGQVQQILMNLAVNARDAMPNGGRLTFETDNVDLKESNSHFQTVVKPGPYVRITVSDTGVGMDEATRARIFEPFFTTKEPGKGTGLGLATVYGIVKQSGGYIWVYSEPGQGTTFRIYLPRVDAEAIVKDFTGTSEDIQSQGTETVLVVEDEAALRRLVGSVLAEQGYRVLEAENVRDAIRMAEQGSRAIHLLLTDVIMPEMNGRELANTLVRRFPAMKVLFMSGYSEGVIDRHGVLDPGVFFLEKPFAPDTLARKVREVLDAS